jgi:Secretion system C-terminal sorting domain/Beta-propeller repeat
MKKIILLFTVLVSNTFFAQTIAQLKAAAATFPAMPKESSEMIGLVQGVPTFSSGTPFSDLEFTLFDTDYMDGENSGGDTFMPVDPSDTFPGANKVKLIKCVLNTDLNENYNAANRDRIILGTHEIAHPFFSKGADNIDNDYCVIIHFDYENGAIQLKGSATDYSLVYCTAADGVATEGWYLFYTANGNIDLIAFIFPCNVIQPAVSGNPPQNSNPMCNSTLQLSLTNPTHFVYAQPIIASVSIPNSIAQFGSNGKEIIGGFTVDTDGNTYLVGLTDGNLDGVADAGNEIFISKISPSGTTLWVRELAIKEGSFLKDAVTDNDFVYVAGRTLGNLPGFTNAGKWDGILLKLNKSDGQIVATNQWGNAGIDGYGCITQDDNGNIFVSAQGSYAGNSGTDDAYLVAKHSKADLSNVWRVIEPTTQSGFAASAEAWGGLTYKSGTTPGNGRLVVAGWVMSAGGANAFASVYENLNNTAPTRPHSIILASQNQRAEWILDSAIDSQGNIYFGGYVTGNFQGTHQGEGDAFIVKYDSSLSNPVFRQFGTPKSDMIRKLEIDANDVIYATGYTYGNYSGNTNADATLSTGDIFVQKFNTNLSYLSNEQYGTPHEDRAQSYLKGDLLYLAGTTEGNFCGNSSGSFDAYIFTVNKNTLQVEQPVLSNESFSNDTFSVYPNPVKDILYFSEEIKVDVYSISGQLLFSGLPKNNQLDFSSYAKGMYILKTENGVKKIIKE